jgi:hypothetical protein
MQPVPAAADHPSKLKALKAKQLAAAAAEAAAAEASKRPHKQLGLERITFQSQFPFSLSHRATGNRRSAGH